MEVRSTQFSAVRALQLRNWLLRILGPGVAHLRALIDEGDVSQLMPALGGLLTGAEPDDVARFMLAALANTTVIRESEKIELKSESQVNRAFAGSLLALDKAFVFALEVNFRDFFLAAFGFLATFLSAPAKAKASNYDSTPESPKTSPFTSSSG